MSAPSSLRIDALAAAYRRGDHTPVEVALAAHERAAADDANAWITLRDREAVAERAKRLTERASTAPLYGVPFAVKDNIDVAGLPTTAGCPAFAYTPETDATVVERLRAAGAVLIGKTNLDQFATGLVGTRSPYGACHNPHDPASIAGGSSAGSGVAVADGQVAFALGTDTAGSGRVPAALTGIVGLKPTRGTLSTAGVVPACRTLDSVAVFGLSCRDALSVARVAAGPDAADPQMRSDAATVSFAPPATVERGTIGVPPASALEFFGDAAAATAFETAVETLERAGWRTTPIDFEPFRETATLLYDGPWVAERLTVVEELIAADEAALLDVTREIISRGASYSATDTFEALYELARLKQRAMAELDAVDALVTPTVGTTYTIDEVAADPIETNSTLGYYTNYVNLLDMAAVAVPTGRFDRDSDIPFGVTVAGPAGTDAVLAGIADALHRANDLPLGATDESTTDLAALAD